MCDSPCFFFPATLTKEVTNSDGVAEYGGASNQPGSPRHLMEDGCPEESLGISRDAAGMRNKPLLLPHEILRFCCPSIVYPILIRTVFDFPFNFQFKKC